MLKRIPYLPFRTFDTFLDDLRLAGLPTTIDRSVLVGKSGATQSQILSALRYLGLRSETGIPTEDLARLIQADGREREQVWESVLKEAYSHLFKLDIENATTAAVLDELWKEGLRSQDTIRKALNFFCLATRAAGIRISPDIKPYAGRRQSPQRSLEKRRERFKVVSFPLPRITANQSESRTGTEVALNKFPEFDPSWPEKERKNWLEGFEEFLRIVRDSEKSNERTASAQKPNR